MEPLFDIKWVTEHFGVTNLGHYLGLIKSASTSELKVFKKHVIKHSKQNRQNAAFCNVPNYSSHKAIISAIKHELRKRSWRYKIFKIIFPIRQWLVKVFSGMELKENNEFGALYCAPKYRSSIWHLSHNELLKILTSFWCLHFKWIITTFSAVTVIYLRVTGKL